MRLAKILVVSIHHMSTEEREKCAAFESLGPQFDSNNTLIGWTLENKGAFYERGWTMQLHPEAETQDLSSFSTGLQEVIRQGVLQGADYVYFSMTADADPSTPDYRH